MPPAHTEESDASYLHGAIATGEAHVIMDMVRELDEIIALLGLEQSEVTAFETLRNHPAFALA